MSPALATAQNPDGGWSYRSGSSWVEPTVYALSSLLIQDPSSSSLERGVAWLRRLQRSDGGWPPNAAVHQSLWVTALVALLPAGLLGADAHRRALDWVMEQTGQESTLTHRLRQWMLGNASLSGG